MWRGRAAKSRSGGIKVAAEVLDRAGSPSRGNDDERITVLTGLELPGVQVWRAEKSLRMWKVFHPVYSFCAVDPDWKGEARWRCRGRDFELTQTGHQLFEPGDVHHTFKVGGPPADFHVLLVSPAVMRTWTCPDAANPPALSVGTIDHAELWEAFQSACRSIRDGVPSLSQETNLARYLRLLVERTGDHSRQRTEASSCDRRVRRVREIVHSRYSENLTLRELAAEVDLSPCHLERTFSARMPLPIHKYLTVVRLAKARELLAAGARPSNVVAAAGFTDHVQMDRAFRTYLGFTPSHYFAATNRRWNAPARSRQESPNT